MLRGQLAEEFFFFFRADLGPVLPRRAAEEVARKLRLADTREVKEAIAVDPDGPAVAASQHAASTVLRRLGPSSPKPTSYWPPSARG